MVALKTLEVRLNERGQILKQFGKVCDALGKGGANRIMTMALNKEDDGGGRTQVRKALRDQTGIFPQIHTATVAPGLWISST